MERLAARSNTLPMRAMSTRQSWRPNHLFTKTSRQDVILAGD
jgi:hypothetical protein